MADYPQPGNNTFSADEEQAMRSANRVPLPPDDPRGPPVAISRPSSQPAVKDRSIGIGGQRYDPDAPARPGFFTGSK